MSEYLKCYVYVTIYTPECCIGCFHNCIPYVSGPKDLVNLNRVAEMVNKQRSASINEFEILHDSSSNSWHVVGSGLQRFVQMTNWR